MIDRDVLARNLKDCIQQFPVKVRHDDRTMFVKLNSTGDLIQTIDAATRDNMSISIVALKSDFGSRPPKSLDDMELFINGKWVLFQIRDVPDYFDPLLPSYMINLQSPERGVE